MKIVVAVRQVVDLDEGFELSSDGFSVDSAFVERDVNEWDNYALEEALSLKDAAGAEVVVVSVGDGEVDAVLHACLAKGADRALRVDHATGGVSDPLVTARLLAAVVEREGPDLVLCGAQSSDTLSGSTGTALAALADLPCVAVIHAIELSDGAGITVERDLDGGGVEVLELSLPAVLTVQTGINKPRHPTLREIKQAKDKPLGVVSLSDLQVDPSGLERLASARVRRLEVPQEAAGAQMLQGDAATLADRISEIIAERLR